MTTMTKAALFWHLVLVNVLLLTEGERSLCGSTELSASHELFTPVPPSARWFDSNLGGISSDSMGKAVSRFNLPVSSTLGTGGVSHKGRLVLGTGEIDPKKSSKEVEVLIDFKSGITKDPLSVLNSWRANDSDPCSWLGVGCENTSKHVISLNLTDLQLGGTVSAQLGQLPFLQHLDLSRNFLKGSLPPSLSNTSNLLSLNVSLNQLSGDVPSLLGQLDNLQILDLSNNSFTGEIPETLGNCSSLQYLDLGANYLVGGVPSQLSHLSGLQSLGLAENLISGSIPSTLGNCSSLTRLSLQNNSKLGGELPLQLGDFIHLEELSIQMCDFQGSFPTFLLNFTEMQDLNLGNNQFSGAIPKSLGQLSELEFLRLESNSFNREIPLGISLLGHLVYMDLSSNALDGEIPTSISNITSLQVLFLQKNQLVGDIPRSIVNISSLQQIKLYQNNLTGIIPKDIGLLTNLETLNINANALTGLIPSSLSNCTLLQNFILGENPFSPQVFPSWIASLKNLASIVLPGANLNGEIPKEIGELSQLYQLSLYSNNLTGVFPPSLGNCTALAVLDVTYNAMSGEVPLEFGLLSGVYSFMIGVNFFSSGEFPSFLYNLTGIQQLGLQHNKFSGRLDGDFGKFEQLSQLQISNNNFQSPISGSFVNCSKLNNIDMGGNNLTGDIPTWLANLTGMILLRVAENNLQGSIPVDLLGNWPLLQELDLSVNNFEGTIPVDIGHLGYLQILDLHSNNFVGVIPDSFGNCTSLLTVDMSRNKLASTASGEVLTVAPSLLTWLNLSYNLFSGSWPLQLNHLANVEVIDVSANNLSGPIPLGLGGCLSLQALNLSFNQFTGPIPQDLGSLKYLTSFNASYNNFVGPIPDDGAFTTNLTAASFLGNPGLCGGILGPQRQCPTPGTSPEGKSHCRGFKCTRVWIPTVSVLGTLLVFTVVSIMVVISSRTKKQINVHIELAMYIVIPRMTPEEKDILAAIAPGQDNVIGVGARSIVYKAVAPGGESVAIKVLRRGLQNRGNRDEEDNKRWEKEIKSEAYTLGHLRHRNIVKLFTLCYSWDIKAIILEYVPKGSLHAHLHGNRKCELTWAQRFKILLGVTHGLVYLHHEVSDPIIHRDLKPSNILLDEDLEPKLCDFGISKFVTDDNGEATASTFCGTFGYIAPEYGTGARLSTKGDVYSYGVVLLELLIGKEGTQALASDILEKSSEASDSQAFELLDTALQIEGCNADIKEQMLSTMRVGLLCTRGQPQNRPSMNEVLLMLLKIQRPGQQEAKIESTLDALL